MPKLPLTRVTLLVALAWALLLPSTGAASPRLVAADSLEGAVLTKVNEVRRARGLRAVASRPELERAAENHARDMAQNSYFAHEWSSGASFSTWIRRYWPGSGFQGSWSAGENLYWRGPTITAGQVVQAWMNSPPHRRNVLMARWRFIGLGAIEMIDPEGAFSGPSRATVVAAEFGYRS